MARKYDPHAGSLFTKEVSKMPEGYYSGDKPNPNLRAFVEQHAKKTPYDQEKDDYECNPLLQSSKVKRSTKLFNMHTYWSKKPHESIEAFVSHYTKQGDLVLDPFCGSGGTLLVSSLNGCHAVGIDLSPAATFFSSVLCNPPSIREFYAAFNDILLRLRRNFGWIYEYPYHKKLWPIHFGISSMRFRCIKCLTISSLYRCGGDEGGAHCPSCKERIKTNQEKFGYQLDEWHLKKGHGDHQVVNIDGEVSEFESDIQKRIQESLKVHVPPSHQFPPTGRTQVLAVRGIKTLIDLYTPRNLLALSLYRDECMKINDECLRNALLFCLTACCLKASRMMGYNSDGIGRIQKNGLIAQLIVKDVNVFDFLEIAYKGIAAGFNDIHERRASSAQVLLSTQSACDLTEMPSQSIDYVFTDPPYGYRVQFWESNQVWEAWLGLDSGWQDREVIVNAIRGFDESHWETLFRQSMQECFRVLKPGRWITLTYNDRDTWPLLQNVMLETGFLPDQSSTAVRMETTAKSEKQLKGARGEDNTIRDLVVNFRKPKPGEVTTAIAITGNEDNTTFNEKVRQIICDYLGTNPGSTKDRIYDEVVSRMVRSGQMEAHDFEELLSQVAEEIRQPVRKNLFENESPDLFGSHEIGHWYLKETESGAEQADQGLADDVAQLVQQFISRQTTEELKKSQTFFDQLTGRITDLEASLEKIGEDDPEKKKSKLRRELREVQQQWEKLSLQRSEWEQQALHYTYISEFYFPLTPKPRMTLVELLEDYFYMTEEGNWRPPLTDEERIEKQRLRNLAARRKLQRFCRLLMTGDAIPSDLQPNVQTLIEWLRYCKRSGLYEQGKLLYEKGGLNLDNLTEEVMVNVEEDYQVCVRMLARVTDKTTSQQKKNK